MENVGFREVMEHAAAADSCATAVLAHILRYWGEAMMLFIHSCDPERIIIGGGIMNAPDLVLASFRKTVSDLAWIEEGQVENSFRRTVRIMQG